MGLERWYALVEVRIVGYSLLEVRVGVEGGWREGEGRTVGHRYDRCWLVVAQGRSCLVEVGH